MTYVLITTLGFSSAIFSYTFFFSSAQGPESIAFLGTRDSMEKVFFYMWASNSFTLFQAWSWDQGNASALPSTVSANRMSHT